MTLNELKTHLEKINKVEFRLPGGEKVPEHFHVTEVGKVEKHFIDCGGTLRKESVINFQLYTANDYDHRLSAEKLRSIIALSEEKLSLENADIEVEYQGNTIGKYHLAQDGDALLLTSTQTDCLAKDNCGIPSKKPKIRLSELNQTESACEPGSGCC